MAAMAVARVFGFGGGDGDGECDERRRRSASCWGVWRETGNGEDGGYGLRKVSVVSLPNPLGFVKGGDSAYWAVLHSWIGQSCSQVLPIDGY
jgi:hypothetical protein